MPYIQARIGKELTQTQITEVYSILTDHIQLLPGKTIHNAMVEVCPGCRLFIDGRQDELAFIDVRLFGCAPVSAKEAYTNAVCCDLENKLKISPQKVYLNYLELSGWGVGGQFKGE